MHATCRVWHDEGSRAQRDCAVHGTSSRRRPNIAAAPTLRPGTTAPLRPINANPIVDVEDARAALTALTETARSRELTAYRMANDLEAESGPDQRDVILALRGNTVALDSLVDRRVAFFADDLDVREAQRAHSASADAAYRALKTAHSVGEAEWSEVRSAGVAALEEYDLLEFMHAKVSDYKALTAEAVAVREESVDPLPRFEDSDINEMVYAGPFETSVGGGDIGVITNIGSNAASARERYKELVAQKAGLTKRTRLDTSDYSSPAARGVAWEATIARKVQKAYPDRNIVQSDAMWRSHEWKHGVAAVDGVYVDGDGVPVGILEIKHASDSSKWGDPSEGLGGVPAGYRAQVLWYSRLTGLDKGSVAVLLDDSELRVYDYEVDDAMRAEQAAMMVAAKGFWHNDVEPARERGSMPQAARRKSAIPKAALGASWNKGRETFLSNVMGFRDQTRAEVIAAHEEILGGRTERTMDEEERRAALKRLYTDFDLSSRARPIAMIDLETTGMSPHHSHIIETGISVGRATRDAAGALSMVETSAVDELHGLDRKASEGRGTGPVEIHHISTQMLHESAAFSDPATQRRVLGALLETGTLWAQNAPFEDGMLRQHLPGYAEARDRGDIGICDTAAMSRHLDGDLEGVGSHSLNSIMERYGMDYVNAHRAKADVDMQNAALLAMAESGPSRNF